MDQFDGTYKESLQSFLNELEEIRLLLLDESCPSKYIMESPGVMKKIIARIPKRCKDELVKLCVIPECIYLNLIFS